VPQIAIGITGALGSDPGLPDRDGIAAGVAEAYGRPVEEVLDLPITGSPQEAAERLAAYQEAGATHAVMGLAGGDWRTQVELLAAARSLLRGSVR
jgi:alkanesulfonate monooxygenase SsuD/methylene tetrahydromethanopterin reductase-like flavin-dependent oxidoreductase (luciferase family)